MAPAGGHDTNDSFSTQVRALLPDLRSRSFAAGEVIFHAGDPGDGFFIVESGKVRISAVVGQNESRLLATIGPRDFFGEMAVLDDAPRSATATAAEPTSAIFVERERFRQLLDQQPRLALLILREFSHRMRALNQKYVDEILQAERLAAVGRFAGTIVHDFKNPLTVIGLATELACADGTPAELRRKAQSRIALQIERMTNMLQELIEFTRPTGQRPSLQLIDFAAFMAPLAEELAQETATRNVTLELATPPPAVELPIDRQRLSRLFYNLVNNAVDAMRGQGKIVLHFNATATELIVSVQDTGPGIAPEIASTLFEPFATHGKAHGTGLGLSICRKIVEDHHGRIWAESVPGKGATFSFTLPRRR